MEGVKNNTSPSSATEMMRKRLLEKNSNISATDIKKIQVPSEDDIELIELDLIEEIKYENGMLMHNRLLFDDRKVEELSADIKEYRELKLGIKGSGLLQPITVRKRGNRYERIIGFRRCEAFKLLGLKEIPAIVIKVSDSVARALRSSENKQRENISLYDEVMNTLEAIFLEHELPSVESSKTLINRYKNKAKLTQKEEEILPNVEKIIVREMTGNIKTVQAFFKKLQALNFNKIIINAIDSKQVSFSQAEYLHRLKKEEDIIYAINYVVRKEPSRHDFVKMIENLIKNNGEKKDISQNEKLYEVISKKFNSTINKGLFKSLTDPQKVVADKLLQEIDIRISEIEEMRK